MDRRLGRELKAIGRDRTSGAAELALRAVGALENWLERRTNPCEADLETIMRSLLRVQPSMAPFWRLANDVALAADATKPSVRLRSSLQTFRRTLQTGRQRIAQYFFNALPKRGDNLIATYSYSCTVLDALIRARSRILSVYCSEGRPAFEGRAMAGRLAKAGIQVLFCTDAKLFSGFGYWRHLVVGADAVLPCFIWNKVGTETLFDAARQRRATVWVLADTTKFCPEPMFGLGPHLGSNRESEKRIWPNAPRKVFVFGHCFGSAQLPDRGRILTERGMLRPPELRRQLREIVVSPKLQNKSYLQLRGDIG